MATKQKHLTTRPEILAPAGSKAAFLSAIAAGADAVYCGLKQFSARMAAPNFSFEELAALTRLAHSRGIRVYIAFNTLIKPTDLERSETFLWRLRQEVDPDALIVQDFSMISLAIKSGFKKEIHLSTLANITFDKALIQAKEAIGAHRVVMPRELHVDEIKQMAAACPKGLGLEVFVHGALCYGVSGRCYWSSYFGGKSGLRGRCVQPCRRRYQAAGEEGRFFSCQDLSLDVLVKVLKSISRVQAWKIEGRKKSPHYVYYTVTAYKMLRDQGHDPQKKRQAIGLLEMALGRSSTHYGFLPQRPQHPVDQGSQTGSGLLVGKVQGSQREPYLITREALLAGDVLRIGYEDDAWHAVRRVNRSIPARGRFYLKSFSRHRGAKGAPVFLVDRQENYLRQELDMLEKELVFEPSRQSARKNPPKFFRKSKNSSRRTVSTVDLQVHRRPQSKSQGTNSGLWLSPEAIAACPSPRIKQYWWWLPPVIWPDDAKQLQEMLTKIRRRGARQFVCNMPGQISLFGNRRSMVLWAGPYCNVANGLAVESFKRMGFSGVIVSPELGKDDYFTLPRQSSLPLGIVLRANWPLCISRIETKGVALGSSFTSPKGEAAWATEYGSNSWLFPNWKLDLRKKQHQLKRAGYSLFVDLIEPIPKGVKIRRRQGLWNWELGLK
jgi:putative protease